MKLCMGCMESIEESVITCPHCGYNETTLRQESYYLDPGTIVGGKYIVGRVLGYGGYTVTYLGMDAELNRKIMVKEYLPSDFSTRSEGENEVTIYSGDALEQFEQGLTTFLNEANRIQHLENIPGIVKVYDCVAENDTGYVISEYLEGHTLKEVLDSGRKFTPQEAKNFISQILEGLRLVHPLDVIHCDIAPETIMITNTGEIKLLDFGATRYVTTANSKSLAIILKQGYAPEEQYRSRGERGPWTDVYALAAVMYRMITGVVPDESVDRALVDELKEPSRLGIQIPKNMENALMNALNVYQKDRTPSAEVFLKELNSSEVRRIQVKKQKYETGKFPRWAKGLVAGLLCLVIGGGFFLHQSNKYIYQAGGTDISMPGIIDLQESEAIEELENNTLKHKRAGINYNPNKDKEGKVSEVTDDKFVKGKLVKKNTEITYNIWSNEECSYNDMFERRGNVEDIVDYFGLLEKLKKKDFKEICEKAQSKHAEEKQYFQLYSIKLKDGTELKQGDLKNIFDKQIILRDIEKIKYYTGYYYHENPLKDNYEGRSISEVRFKKYRKDKGEEIFMNEKGCPQPNPVYISISPSYKVDMIVKQTIEKEKEYDSLKNKYLFLTVKSQIDWSGLTGNALKEKLNNIGIKSSIVNDKNDLVDKVEAEGKSVKNVNDGTLFLKDDEVKVTITTKVRPTPTPTLAPTPQLTPKPNRPSTNKSQSEKNLYDDDFK